MKNRSISTKLLIYILIFSSVITLLTTAINVYLDYLNEMNIIQNRIDDIEDSYLQSLSYSLWYVDDDSVNKQLEGILRLPNVQYVEITTKLQKNNFFVGIKKSGKNISHEFPLIYYANSEQFILGNLKIVFNLDIMYHRLIDRLLIILFTQGLEIFLVAVFIYFLVQWLITHHLIEISDYVKKMDYNNKNVPLKLNKATRKMVEFKNVEDAINRMNNNLYEKIDALRESEEKFRTIIDASSDAIFITDQMGNYVYVNKAATELLGYSFDELTNMSILDVSHPDRIEIEKQTFLGILKGGKMFTETLLKNNKGNFIPVDLSAVLLPNELVFGSCRDLSDKVKLQEELSHRIKMDAVGELAGGIAHDFNNVLTGIMSASQLLSKPKNGLNDKCLNYVGIINQASVRASDLIKKLLLFSRKGEVNKEIIDIDNILNETVDILKSTIDKKIDVFVEKEANNVLLVGDHSILESAFLNLGINSSQAMPNGGNINIVTKNIMLDSDFCNKSSFNIKPGEYIRVEFTDSGHGISEENISKIFEPFFTTKSVNKGTGLGLSAVYGTVQDHNGFIEVESNENVGTTFYIYLPCTKKETLNMKNNNSVLLGSGTILLVDDEEMNRILIGEILEELGYTVLLANDGMESVDIYKNSFPNIDIVIMDMIMPRMNGSEAFYKIREINPECKVIISSGYTKDQSIDELLKDGLKGFIKKPFSISEISKILEETL